MISEVPNFDAETVAKHASALYGIEGSITPLVSFEDQNALITAVDRRYVFKIANRRWSNELLQLQHQAMLELQQRAPQLTFPEPLTTYNGDTLTKIDGFNVYVLSYVDGVVYSRGEKSLPLYRDAGRFLGQLSQSLQDFSHPASHRVGYLWDLDNVIDCRAHLEDIDDSATRERIGRLFEHYETRVGPRLRGLRKAVIHGDANEHNFIIDRDHPQRMHGLIDFGDMMHSTQVNELAIALAYLLLGERDIGTAARAVIDGYCAEFALVDEELAVLFELVAMRLVTSIVMSSNEAKIYPDNSSYILTSQAGGQALLQRLEEQNYLFQ